MDRSRTMIIVVAIAAVAAIAIAAIVTFGSHSSTTSATSSTIRLNTSVSSTTAAPTTTATESLTTQEVPFVGAWRTHGIGITISSSGAGTGAWRTYNYCSNSPPPCDAQTQSTLAGGQPVTLVTNGGAATFTIHSVSPSTVAHVTSSSNEPTTFPSGEIEFSLIGNDELMVTSPSTNVSVTLCGPAAPTVCFGA
jgi:hypothetical protein